MGLADERKPVNLMTVHVSKSVTVHEVSNSIMQKRTHNVINEFQKKYNFDILDLTYDKGFSDELFCDWSHLNAEGANLATEKINCYMDKILGKSDCEKIDER